MQPPSCGGSLLARRWWAIGVGLLGGLLPPGPLAAQQGEVRAAVERLHAEVAGEESQRRLEALARELRRDDESDSATLALRLIRLGFVQLRLIDLGAGAPPPNGEFERASRLRPQWAYAWYGRGRAKRAEGDWLAGDGLNLGSRVGFGDYEEAVTYFERALALEPAFVPALRELAATITLLKDTARTRGILLPALARAPSANDSILLQSRIAAERSLGDPGTALDAARRLLALTGPSARSLRDLAWSGFLAGDPDAGHYYFAGAAHDDSAGVALYREDLALIADEMELAGFDASRASARAEFLRRFWQARDHASLRGPGVRLAEHYRRIAEAERRFGLEVNRRYHHAWDSYRSGSLRFDDRGIVYIRHGEPDDTASSVTFGLPPNLTWRYRRADGDLLLHFAANPGSYEYGAGGDLHDYRLIPSLWAIIRPGGPAGQNALEELLESRCPMFEPYCKYNGWGRYGRRQIVVDEQDIVSRSTVTATETDGDELRFRRGLAGDAALFAVGSDLGRPVVHAVWQLLMARPAGADSTITLRTPARVRFALLDSTGQSVGWVDTVVTIGAPATRDTVIVPGRVAVAVPPGAWRYRLAIITDDSTGRVFATDSVRPNPVDGSRLVVSNLVLGRRDVSVPWAASPADTAWFTPGERWRQGDVLEVYHEVYGLAPEEPYRARLVVRRGRRAVLTLGWEGRATAGVTRVSRSLDLASLRAADYRLEIEVTSARGAKAVSSRALGVRGRRKE
jgi:GWxTD domain-containing protein